MAGDCSMVHRCNILVFEVFFLPITCAFMCINIRHTKGISTNIVHVRVTRGHYSNLSTSKNQSLDCLRDDKTSRLLMILELAIGMPVMCTKDNSGPKEFTNGTCHWIPVANNCNYTLPNH